MVQHSRGASLQLETAQAIGIGGEAGGQHLDRDISSQARVAGTIDFAHAAGPQFFGKLVGAKFRERKETHCPAILAHWIYDTVPLCFAPLE
jgi:hypothetical protein